MSSDRCASRFFDGLIVVSGLLLGTAMFVSPSGAQQPAAAPEAAIVKCPDTRRNCAVGLVVANKKSHSFRIFQASETPLVGKRRQLSGVAIGQKGQPVDLEVFNGRVLIVEYDDGDPKTLHNARIISSVLGQ